MSSPSHTSGMLIAVCPLCGRRSLRVPATRYATTIIRRTCRCGSVWQIKQTPRSCKVPGAAIHILDFCPLGVVPRGKR